MPTDTDNQTSQLPDFAGHEGMLKRASLVTAGTALSRTLGFIRDILIAHFLGAGPIADIFLAVLRLPNILRRLFTEGAVSMPFMPAYLRLAHQEGPGRADAFARAIRAWILAGGGFFCLLGLIFPLPLLFVLAPGLLERMPDAPFAAMLMRISLPYVPLLLFVCVSAALLQSRDDFLAPSLAPCILNICLILPLLVMIGSGHLNFAHPGPQTARAAAQALTWALPLAGLVQVLYLGRALRRRGFSGRGPFQWRDTAAAKLGRMLPASLCVTAAHQICVLIAVMAASFLPEGYITQVHFADQLIELPLGIFGMALAVAVLPSFSALTAPDRRGELQDAVGLSTRLTLFVALPATAGLFGLARPIVDVLFGHGAFTQSAVDGCAALLSAYALCLPALAAARPLIAAVHALRKTAQAARAALWAFAGTALTCGAAAALASAGFESPLARSAALGLGISLGAYIFLWLLLRALAREGAAPHLGKILAGMPLPLALSWGIAVVCRTCATLWPELAVYWLVLLIPACIIAYTGACLAARNREILLLLPKFKNRRK